MDQHDGVLAGLLATARRRCIWHLFLDNLALALTVAMGGAILLLLAGNQILNWYWVAILAMASLGVSLYRTRGRVPSTYQVAQHIDARLKLADSLSTAAYFAESQLGDPEIRERQREDAEGKARGVNTRIAIPFTRPRFAFPAVGLALIAVGMFALRFAVTGSMSLEPSLMKVAFDTFFGTAKQQVAKNNPGKLPKDVRQPIEPGSTDSPTTTNDMAPDSVLDTVDDPDVNAPMGDEAKSKSTGRPQDQNGNDQGENGDKGDKGAPNNEAQNQDNPSQGDQGKDGKQSSGKQDSKQDSKQGANQENASLMDKLRDAVANMMNKMKLPQKDGQQNTQNSQNGKQDGSNQKGQQQSKNQSQSAEKEAQADQEQGDNGDKRQSADAKSGEKSADKSAPQDSKSGIGSEDGDKSAREAEQLQAMGKLSEVLGKRSANVTGEVMVEVGSSKQQLRTPFAAKQAQHSDAGGEIHRDEVPLMYQQFVQQYFEEIRKTPEAAAKGTGTGAKSTPGSKDEGKTSKPNSSLR